MTWCHFGESFGRRKSYIKSISLLGEPIKKDCQVSIIWKNESQTWIVLVFFVGVNWRYSTCIILLPEATRGMVQIHFFSIGSATKLKFFVVCCMGQAKERSQGLYSFFPHCVECMRKEEQETLWKSHSHTRINYRKSFLQSVPLYWSVQDSF